MFSSFDESESTVRVKEHFIHLLRDVESNMAWEQANFGQDLPYYFIPDVVKELTDKYGAYYFTELSSGLINLFCDRGMNRRVEYYHEGGQREEVGPIRFMNRNGFIFNIFKKYKTVDEARGNLKLYMIDIQLCRESDFVRDEFGNSYANVVLNKLALMGNRKVVAINIALKQIGVTGEVAIARYGGDEICLGFMGIPDEYHQFILDYMINERDGFQSIDNLYNFGDELGIYKGKLRIKPVTEVSVPNGKARSKKFWENLENGLITDEKTRKKKRKRSLTRLDKYYLESELSDLSLNQLCELLLNEKGTFGLIGDSLMKVLNNHTWTTPERAEQLYKLLQRLVRDNLVGGITYSMTDLANAVQSKNLDYIVVCDVKKIKGVNDGFSIVDGDIVIQGGSIPFKRAVNYSKEVGRSGGLDVRRARSGSTNVVTICGFDKLTSFAQRQILWALSNTNYGRIVEDGEEVIYPVNTFIVKVDKQITSHQDAIVCIEEALNKAEERWYLDLLVKLHEDPLIIEFLLNGSFLDDIDSIDFFLNESVLQIPEFLLRKRGYERIKSLLLIAERLGSGEIHSEEINVDYPELRHTTQFGEFNTKLQRLKRNLPNIIYRLRKVFARVEADHIIQKKSEIERFNLVKVISDRRSSLRRKDQPERSMKF